MRKVQIYVDNQRVDLFKDEKIEVKSSVQDIADISKVFTDFSQAFTLPASDNNNVIFGFYYNNDNDTFDANTRVAARIEIDGNPFREGKLQLEGTTVKNNQIESYRVSFYGDVVTLKDLMGEDKLKDLDYSSLSTVYDGATVQASITTTTPLDVRFPLISSERVWTYNDGTGINDSTTYAIVYDELFPALTDSKILSLIESEYGITFQGNYLTDDRFLNSYTYWKNRETTNFTSEAVDLAFNAGAVSCDASIPDAVGINEVNLDYINPINLATPVDWLAWYPNTFQHSIQILFTPATTVTYYLDVYKNGLLYTTFTDDSAQLWDIVTQSNPFGLDDVYTFKARAAGALTFDFTVKYKLTASYETTFLGLTSQTAFTCNYSTSSVSITTAMDFASAAPDMKVSDWLSGTLSESNLTCYPVDTLTYQIEPLEDWYAGGDTVNITPYVDIKDIKYDRLKLYNEVSFSWQKSKAFLNVAYEGFHGKEYGDLKEVFPNHDGGKYTVKLPFETMLFNNFDTINNNLQVGYSLTNAPDYKPYIPKPVKLYLNESKTCEFYFDNGSTIPSLTSYMPFGQSSVYNGSNYSMNFGEEVDSLTLNPVPNSLYQTYYQPYLLNLFDTKSRKVTVSCILPLNMLIRLSLDDAIIIRDKKYRINDMTTDLTSGLVKLVLVSDWVKDRGGRTPNPPVVQTGGIISVPIKPPRGGWIDIDVPVETQFVTSSLSLPVTKELDEVRWLITVPSNSTGSDRYQTINYRGYYPDGSEAWERIVIIDQKGSSDFLLTESGGYLLQENLDKILL